MGHFLCRVEVFLDNNPFPSKNNCFDIQISFENDSWTNLPQEITKLMDKMYSIEELKKDPFYVLGRICDEHR